MSTQIKNRFGLSPLFIAFILSLVFVILSGGVTLTRLEAQSSGTSWYVSPTGTSQGDGSLGNPWDLQTALSHPAPVKPGDTVWL